VTCRLDHGTPCLEVADDGPGVAAADRTRIFERFFRVAGSGERGAGLGLSLVARIAAMHGAVLEDPPAPRGFHLVVRFPAAGSEPGATPAPAAAQLRPGTETTDERTFPQGA